MCCFDTDLQNTRQQATRGKGKAKSPAAAQRADSADAAAAAERAMAELLAVGFADSVPCLEVGSVDSRCVITLLKGRCIRQSQFAICAEDTGRHNLLLKAKLTGRVLNFSSTVAGGGSLDIGTAAARSRMQKAEERNTQEQSCCCISAGRRRQQLAVSDAISCFCADARACRN